MFGKRLGKGERRFVWGEKGVKVGELWTMGGSWVAVTGEYLGEKTGDVEMVKEDENGMSRVLGWEIRGTRNRKTRLK
jgi:hypothetical protein